MRIPTTTKRVHELTATAMMVMDTDPCCELIFFIAE